MKMFYQFFDASLPEILGGFGLALDNFSFFDLTFGELHMKDNNTPIFDFQSQFSTSKIIVISRKMIVY